MAGTAAVAAAAGGGLAWWRLRPGEVLPAEVEQLWTLTFDTPAGGTLAMAPLRGKPVLLNFWATWCPPCVEEMPMLDAFAKERQAAGWTVVGLAIDQPSAVRQFLAKRPVGYPIGLAGLGGTELGKGLGNAAGGLPFTVVLGADGQVRERRMGKLSPADLASWAAAG